MESDRDDLAIGLHQTGVCAVIKDCQRKCGLLYLHQKNLRRANRWDYNSPAKVGIG